MKDKFKYAMNAIHYSIYREQVCVGKKLDDIIFKLYSMTLKHCLTQRIKFKIYRRCIRNFQETDDYMYGEKFGHSIGMAHHIFGYFYSSYPLFISCICLGIANRISRGITGLPAIIIIAIPVAFGYIPAYKAVFSNDIYLKYFKKFRKKDERWLQKWKWITIAFCIGGILTVALGFYCMTIIIHY